MVNCQYFRLNPMVDNDVYLDETDDAKLLNLMWEAHVYIYENQQLFDELALALAK